MTLTGDFTYFLLIFARMSSCVFFNQIFGRGNLPNMFKISLSLILAYTVFNLLPSSGDIVFNSALVYGIVIVKELFIGYIIGYLINLFFSVVVISGEIIDIQVGMSMSKIYDPHSNISLGLTGSFLNIFLVLIFFSAGGHLSLIKIFITSCKVINIGMFTIPKDLFYNMVQLLSEIFVYSMKIAIPFIAVEIIVEAGMGILMKAIPQIQVFSLNIQLKLFIGLFLIVILVPSFSAFLNNILSIMFETIENSLSLLMT